nr:hypothetical protein [Lachnospiraceae bacterium]
MNEKSIFTLIREAPLPDSQKLKLESIVRGEELASVCRDSIAKHVFSPDLHPERMNFILQHTMNRMDLNVSHSASNETYLQNVYAKKTITDVPAWLKDHSLADLEFQIRPQEFIFNRADVYASNMLLLQYSADEARSREEIDFDTIHDSIIIVLMAKSPKAFKE